ncbi:lysoplasmalogenase family protein [Xylanimonas ulmi]|uniref:YhhN-like protein n=1 Tax=Xylanimonas ulmi TaxID=228973 RepID=A0A4Q7M140_9MICO|nr:lysoplasmalogenase family protein [Xylanibacterium ulmi]RZS61104.1 YhhN-like protein [Xylanibacterium ulmi]
MHDDVHTTGSDDAAATGPGFDPEPVPDPGGALPATFFDPLRRRIEPWLPTRAARAWFGAFAALVVVHLGAHFVGPVRVAGVTQWLLVPLLAASLWCAIAAPRPRLAVLSVLALLCSWAGDTVPAFAPDAVSFLVLMGLFACAQAVYVRAFAPFREASVLRRRRGVVVVYLTVYAAVVVAGLVSTLRWGASPTWAAAAFVAGLAVYGALLVTMAVLATGVDRLAGVGGALFLVSDGLLGVGQVAPQVIGALPRGVFGFAVMLTYLAAQTLIAAGVRRRSVGGHT